MDSVTKHVSDPFLSVIVCTYNRSAFLDKCLTSLRNQDLPRDRFEVIVVDNNSTDDTPAVAATHARACPDMRYVVETQQGLSHARNRGCREARGDYLVYNDDDAILPPEYLRMVAKVIREHAPEILGGPVYPYYTSRKPHWFRDQYEVKNYEGRSGFSTTCRVTGVNFIIRKELLERLGMFDPSLGMKGDQLGLGEEAKVLDTYRAVTPREAQKVFYSQECYVRHHIPPWKMDIPYALRRSFQTGRMKVKMEAIRRKVTPFYLIDTVARRLSAMARRLGSEIVKKGPAGADYVTACRTFLFILGMATEGLARLFRGERTP